MTDLRIIQVYDVFGLADSLFERAEKHIFSEQVTDTIWLKVMWLLMVISQSKVSCRRTSTLGSCLLRQHR